MTSTPNLRTSLGALADPKLSSPISRGRKDTLLTLLRTTLGPANYERLQFRRHVGYWPDLKNPKTFNEKIAHRKLFDVPPDAALLSDKVAVRDFVARTVGEKYLNRAIRIAEDAGEIDFAELPASFAAKASHGSAMNLLVPDKSLLDIDSARERLARFLAYRFGKLFNETWYEGIPRRILVESFLHDERFGVPLDMKCMVFHGKVELIRVVDRFGGHGRSFYDADWRPQEIEYREDATGTIFEPPRPLRELVEVAEALAQGRDFVRVDLYCLNDREVIFGEVTLAPGSGWQALATRAHDEYLGSLW